MVDPCAASLVDEAPLDPQRLIIDPHHHLWSRRPTLAGRTRTHPFEEVLELSPRYLSGELLADVAGGHDVRATVYVECGSSYRAEGEDALRPVGETEFAVAEAQAAETLCEGQVYVALGIVAHADLTLGAGVEPVLAAHQEAAGDRFKGVRHGAAYDADPSVLGPLVRAPGHLMLDPRFQEGVRALGRAGLSFDAWLLEPQLGDLIALSDACPQTLIVLDHLGAPLGIGRYEGRRDARFGVWREAMSALAERPRVVVKVGGLAMPFAGFERLDAAPTSTSETLAALWRPYIETAVELFGARRCMFESNFPVDRITCTYSALWNTFKRLSEHWSETEKTALFSGCAAEVYRLRLNGQEQAGSTAVVGGCQIPPS